MGNTQEQNEKIYTDEELCWAAQVAYNNGDSYFKKYITVSAQKYDLL
ncbi:MAG: hypothetical protein NC094_02715 [Bacteroidales bacterium]|nr:hypothetical protein [Lachnoclostridium sp.]MCM1383462.1 hypothetical protein [Lachnoclostridium sp.]MCM1464311.1 hypothetical protein [Bacteroidales bacterium]